MAMRAVEQDQERLLDEAASVVKEQAFFMRRAIENENLRDALKHSSIMICELRTSLLSPKNYYELYMQVFQELQHLGAYFSDPSRMNRKMSELYESVQHAGNILPRLYLLITVGAAYIKSKEAPARDILRDMTELCKGVQHPMRGLFLRYYLTQMCKDKLPDAGSEYEGEESGSISDAFDFLMCNFQESSRLWVRLQHQGPVKDKAKREKERHDLRVLVGANLVRLSQLEGMTHDFYATTALPKILEQVVTCKDTMAQQYLLDCIIQVFSDECHLRTLDQLLAACMKVQPTVDLKPILVNLMNRLASFIQSNPEGVPAGVDIFGLFKQYITELLQRPLASSLAQQPAAATAANTASATGAAAATSPLAASAGGVPPPPPQVQVQGMDVSSLLELQVAFLNFTLTIYPKRVDYVDVILSATVDLLARVLASDEASLQAGAKAKKLTGAGVESVVDLLSAPLRTLSLTILEMDHYTNLMKFLNFQTRKQVAASMVSAVLSVNTPFDDPEAVQRFFTFISPLIQDQEDSPCEEDSDKDEFVYEQQQVCKLVHAIQHADSDQVFAMYTAARTFFGQGGPRRMLHTLPALVVCALKLVPLIQMREEQARMQMVAPPTVSVKKVFQFIHKTCTALVSCAPEIALRLFLNSAVVANQADIVAGGQGTLEPICYEFLTQSMVCYEEELSDSKSQVAGLTMMVGTLVSFISCLEPDNYDTLATKITQHSAKLLKKPDQCRAVLTCSNLFWNNPSRRDGRRVLECLQKALKIADIAIQSSSANVALFVEILDKYVYYFDQGNHEITLQFISNLVALCSEHLAYGESDSMSLGEARTNFTNTIAYMRSKMTESNSRYIGLNLDDVGAH